MSWGSEAASTGSSSAPPAVSAGGYGGWSMSDFGGAESAAPVDGTGVSLTSAQQADVASYGTSNPTFMDKASSGLERFSKGGEQGLGEAWRNRGVNPETAGFIYSKAGQMAGAGKQQPQASPMNTTINYQQPTNPYLAKRGRY